MKVKQMQLHKALFVPCGINLPRTVSNDAQSCAGIEMTYQDNGTVHCKWREHAFIISTVQYEVLVLDVQKD